MLLVTRCDGSSTVQVKDCSSVPVVGSSTVTVTEYGDPAAASTAMVPVISPVSGSMDKPSGNPVAAYVNTSPSTSDAVTNSEMV